MLAAANMHLGTVWVSVPEEIKPELRVRGATRTSVALGDADRTRAQLA